MSTPSNLICVQIYNILCTWPFPGHEPNEKFTLNLSSNCYINLCCAKVISIQILNESWCFIFVSSTYMIVPHWLHSASARRVWRSPSASVSPGKQSWRHDTRSRMWMESASLHLSICTRTYILAQNKKHAPELWWTWLANLNAVLV